MCTQVEIGVVGRNPERGLSPQGLFEFFLSIVLNLPHNGADFELGITLGTIENISPFPHMYTVSHGPFCQQPDTR